MYGIFEYFTREAREYAASLTYVLKPKGVFVFPRTDDEHELCPLGACLLAEYRLGLAPLRMYPAKQGEYSLPGSPHPSYLAGLLTGTYGYTPVSDLAVQFTSVWDDGLVTDLRAAMGLDEPDGI